LSITHLQVVHISGTSATVSWDTNQPASSAVGYGLNQLYQLSADASNLTTTHSVALDPAYLAPGLVYHLRITSTNAAGASTTSLTSFMTTGFNVKLHIVSKSGHTLAGATVKLAGQSLTTNSQGEVSFANVPYGAQPVSVSYWGASTKSNVAVGQAATNSKSPASQSFTLTAATVGVQPIAIAIVIVVLALFGGWEVWQWRKPKLKPMPDATTSAITMDNPPTPEPATSPAPTEPQQPSVSDPPLPGARFEPATEPETKPETTGKAKEQAGAEPDNHQTD
jgi:hypothetical protein